MKLKEWFAIKFLDTNKPKFQVRICPIAKYDHYHDIEYNNSWGYFGWSKIYKCGNNILTGYPAWFTFSLDIMRHTVEWHIRERFNTLEKVHSFEKNEKLKYKLMVEQEDKRRNAYSDKLKSFKK